MYNISAQLQLGFSQATLFLEFVDAAVWIHGQKALNERQSSFEFDLRAPILFYIHVLVQFVTSQTIY